MRIANGSAAIKQADGIEDVARFDLVEIKIGVIERQAQALGRDAKAVIDINDVGNRAKGFAHLGGDGAAGFGVGAVNLGQHGCHDRRAWWWLDDLDDRTFGQGEG